MSIAQSAAATAATQHARTGPTGPRTAEGKARCRLNAFRHGLTAQTFVFTAYEAAAFAKHSAAISDHYKPIGPVETILTAQIASAMWRLLRVHPIEEGIFALDAALTPDPNTDGVVTATSIIGPAHAWIEQGKSLDLLGKYERRLRRALERDQAQLLQLQSIRKAQPEPAAPHATESVFSPELTSAKPTPRETLSIPVPVTNPVPVANLVPIANPVHVTNPVPVANLVPLAVSAAGAPLTPSANQ